EALLVADTVAVGRVGDDEAGRFRWRDEVADGALVEVRKIGDAGARGIGAAHFDGAGITVAPVEAEGRPGYGRNGAPHVSPLSGIERGELLESEVPLAAWLEAHGNLRRLDDERAGPA